MNHQHDLPYDFEDFGLTVDELRVKYPSGHMHYTIPKWNADPEGQGATHAYWDWVVGCIAADDDAIPSTEEESKEPSETVPIEDMGQLLFLVSHWHKNKVAELEHMLSLPEGTEASLNDGPTLLLEGARHEGFVLGLSLALVELGTLPFAVELQSQEAVTSAPKQHVH